MKKAFLVWLVVLSVGLYGCSNSESEGLTKKEQEQIYREEVRKKLDEEAVAEEAIEKEPEVDPGEQFDALPAGTRASVMASFYDERASADSLVNMGMYVSYSFEEPYAIIQVTSGVGSGHPIYLLERKEDSYVPVDGVVFVGANKVESSPPPQVEVHVTELYEAYLAEEALFNQADETAYSSEMTLAEFNSLKDQIGKGPVNDPGVPIVNEIVGTVDGVTNTIDSFFTIEGSVGLVFYIHNGSQETIEYSPNDIQLYKDGESLPINDTGDSGVLAPGETGESYILFDSRGLEPYVLDWNGLQITMIPVVA